MAPCRNRHGARTRHRPTGQGVRRRAGATATRWMSLTPQLPSPLPPATRRQSRARAAPSPAVGTSTRRGQACHRHPPPEMASSRPPHVDPDDRLPTSSVRCSVYLFGRLTNQWCHQRAFLVKQVALSANAAMIVREGDESNEIDDAYSADGKPDPPVV